MMGLIDCSAMATNEILVDAVGDDEKGWDAWSYLTRFGEIHRPILSTNSGQFRTKEQATAWMDSVVQACKAVPEGSLMSEQYYAEALAPCLDAFIKIMNEGKDAEEDVIPGCMECAVLREIIEEVNAWAVCAAIASPEDMMENIGRIIDITTIGSPSKEEA